MSGTKPTPGPWYVVRSSVNALHVCFDPGTPHAEGDEICALFGGDEVTPEMWANARLIVRAVNCHADLVAALAPLAKIADWHETMLLTDEHTIIGFSGETEHFRLTLGDCRKARAALAKALEP